MGIYFCHQTRFITTTQVTANLAEIRIRFVHDMGTSMEGLQPCRLFPAQGKGTCECVCVL